MAAIRIGTHQCDEIGGFDFEAGFSKHVWRDAPCVLLFVPNSESIPSEDSARRNAAHTLVTIDSAVVVAFIVITIVSLWPIGGAWY